MARIAKSGLEYFPFDIDFFQDIRIRKLIKRQGGKAVTVYALLLCLIYKNGYYMQWDDELPFIGSEMSGFDEAYVSEVIKTCLSLGLFDKNMYDTEQVLTSKGIQVRYCNIQRLNKRMSRIDRYSLIEELTKTSLIEELTKTSSTRNRNKQAKPAKPASPKPAVAPQPEPLRPAVPQPPTTGTNAEWLTEFFADNTRKVCSCSAKTSVWATVRLTDCALWLMLLSVSGNCRTHSTTITAIGHGILFPLCVSRAAIHLNRVTTNPPLLLRLTTHLAVASAVKTSDSYD